MNKSMKGIVAVVVLMFVLSGVFTFQMNFKENHHYNLTITDKERVNKDDESYYLVFAKDSIGQTYVFKNEDNLLHFKFDSSNTQGALLEGATFNIDTVGYRIPILNMYENIIRVERVVE